MRTVVLLAWVLIVVAGCGGTAASSSQPPTGQGGTGTTNRSTRDPTTPTPLPSPAPTGGRATEWGLRYLLLDHYPTFAYCDPDLYPIARDDEQTAADQWWTATNRRSSEAVSILNRRRYREPLTPGQRLGAYRDHKKLTVIVMRPVSAGFEFEFSIGPGGEPNQTVTGIITEAGQIDERSRKTRAGGCPICLEAATRIATPKGDVTIDNIEPGDLVWTTDADGHRMVAPVERVTRRPTPGPHLMLRLALTDGRMLVVAGAHPGEHGEYLRQVRPGQRYDGATVASAEWVRSTAPATFDILPAGPTGRYWANAILVGSTLR